MVVDKARSEFLDHTNLGGTGVAQATKMPTQESPKLTSKPPGASKVESPKISSKSIDNPIPSTSILSKALCYDL